jgi:hypothetical protein
MDDEQRQAHERRMIRARALLIWMEHENHLAARELALGGWLSDHTAALAALHAELQAVLEEDDHD